jgi:hypothetical protein
MQRRCVLKSPAIISAPGKDEAKAPIGKGLCYTNFIIQPADAGVNTLNEKLLLTKLLSKGIPYLYWLHSLPHDGLEKIETSFAKWLEDLPTLDQFPSKFTQERIEGNEFALQASLLWDDPEFDPFLNARGGRVK